MALIASVDSGFGPEDRYVYIRSFSADRANGIITGRLEIYKDQATRDRYKAADAALKSIDGQIKAKMVDHDAERERFDALSAIARNEQRTDHDEVMAALESAIEVLKSQQSAQTQTFNANRPGKVEDFAIPPGRVEIPADGGITLGAIYDDLAANQYAGAVRAD